MLDLGKATVRGWWTAGIQDGPDPDTAPDEVPLAGLKITLEPLTRVLTIPADVEGERSKTVILKPFDLTTDANGLMYNPASGGTSPDVSITPSNALSDNPDEYIRWRATINAGDTGVPAIVKTFIALRDEIVDLPTVEQVPDAPVINLTEWMRLVADARAAKDLAVLAAGQAQDFASAAAGSAAAASGSATSAAQSATDAGTALTSIPGTVAAEVSLQVPPAVSTELAAQVPPAVTAELATQGIVIDTTAGTKVTIGGHVVYYYSRIRDVTASLINGWTADKVYLSRTLDTVTWEFHNLNGSAATGTGVLPSFDGFWRAPVATVRNSVPIRQRNTLTPIWLEITIGGAIHCPTGVESVSGAMVTAAAHRVFLPTALPGIPA